MGLDIYSENYSSPCRGCGHARPPRPGMSQNRSGLGWGEWEEDAFLRKEDQDGVLGSGCLGLSILLLLSCAVLSFFFLFLKTEIRAGEGKREGPWKGLLLSLGHSWKTLPAVGWHGVHSKLLINRCLF